MSGIDWFMGGICEAASDLPLDKFASLSRQAEDFLRSGLSWQEWALLGTQSRAAFIDAGNRLRIEQAAILGLACSSKEAALELMAKLDGGKGKVADTMARVMADALARLEMASKEIG